MKRILLIILAILMIVCVVASCNKENKPISKTDEIVASFKTFGEVLNNEKINEMGYSTTEGKNFVYIFTIDDVYYNVSGPLSDDVYEKYCDIDALDDNYEQKIKEVLSPVKITKWFNISNTFLSKENLKSYAGQKGSYLLDQGWKICSFDFYDKMFTLEYEYGEYQVECKGTIDVDQMTFEGDPADIFKDLIIDSVIFSSISNKAFEG